jgi:hypothetical protein
LIQRAKSGALEFGCFAQDDISVFILRIAAVPALLPRPSAGATNAEAPLWMT